MSPQAAELRIGLPEWITQIVAEPRRFGTDEDKMRFTVELARANVTHATGGPFAAAVFDSESGAVVAVGVNSVVRLHNSTLHGEIVALMLAQQRLQSFSLSAPGLPAHELVSSCEPCAMCLGAILWSGVKRVVCGALREDATQLGFEEGPVFPASYSYLEERGIRFQRGVLRDDARGVLELYRSQRGPIYNA